MKILWPIVKYLLLAMVMLLLTVATQIGGAVLLVVLLFAFIFKKRWKKLHKPLPIVGMFVLAYFLFALALVPILAPLAGRTALPCFSGNLRPLNLATCLCNRHYVLPEMEAVALDAAKQMAATYPGTKLYYLDANFPFINGFPLVPHLSHNDGKKLDLAFYYNDKDGNPLDGAPSPIGYGVFEDPKPGEANKPQACASAGQWQYGFMKKVVSQQKKQAMFFDAARTTELLLFFCRDERVKKMFLEPHLKARLGLAGYGKVRYQGCHSVRHDDHVHIQL